MKKLLFILILFSRFISQAQIEKHALLLGPGLSYYAYKNSYSQGANPLNNSDYKVQDLLGVLRAGYFINDKTAAGVIVMYDAARTVQNSTNSGNNGTMDFRRNIVSAGVFGRRYKMFSENRFGIFCHLEALLQVGTSKTTNTTKQNGISGSSSDHGDITGYQIGFRPGFVFFVTPKIGLELSVGNISYSHTSSNVYTNGAKTNSTTNDNVNAGFAYSTFIFGLNFYLGGGK